MPLGGDPAGFLNALERAEVAFTDAGERAGAARMALEQARHHALMLDGAVALTCYVRATELLARRRSAPSTRRRVVAGLHADGEGDADGARAALLEARAIARRVGSPGMEAMAVQGLAHVAATEGDRLRCSRCSTRRRRWPCDPGSHLSMPATCTAR